MSKSSKLLAMLLISTTAVVVADDGSTPPVLREAELGSTRNVHAFGMNLLCGQPSAEEFRVAKRRGIEVVITLRETGEIDWDERGTVEGLGLEFHHFGFRSPDSLTDEILDRSLELLAKSSEAPVMLHCASANRVGAVWMAHRVVNDKIPVEKALKEAKEVGLRTDAYESKTLDYIRRRLAGD